MAPLLGHPKTKKLYRLTPDQGLSPWTLLRDLPQTLERFTSSTFATTPLLSIAVTQQRWKVKC